MRYSQSRVYSLVIHDDAQTDLDQIFAANQAVAGDITVFLEEINGNQDLLDRLVSRRFCNYEDPQFDVDEWQKTKVTKFNLWRVRLLWLSGASDYRIIYAFHTIEYRYYVLAILKRDFDYDISNPRVKRIFKIYDALNIPRY